MESRTDAVTVTKSGLHFDFGSFEGFNFRTARPIECLLTAEKVITWNHETNGEAEFWPSGSHTGAHLIFQSRNSITGAELVALDNLLTEMGGDEIENFLRLHFALNHKGCLLTELTLSEVEDRSPSIYLGTCFYDLRKEAAYELFETYWPEAYRAWESSHCDGLIFDTDVFLDSPVWEVEEITLGAKKALLVCPL